MKLLTDNLSLANILSVSTANKIQLYLLTRNLRIIIILSTTYIIISTTVIWLHPENSYVVTKVYIMWTPPAIPLFLLLQYYYYIKVKYVFRYYFLGFSFGIKPPSEVGKGGAGQKPGIWNMFLWSYLVLATLKI